MKTLSRIIIVFLLFASKISDAQPYFKWDDSIKVKIGGNYLANPWAGGLNFIQISDIDLNLDGIKDLFLFDRSGNKIRTFINKGTPGVSDYKYDPQYESKFPPIHDWALLVDYNNDQKNDIFTYSNFGGGIDVYKNISTPATGLKFQKVVNQLLSVYYPPQKPLNLYVSVVDVPAFSDIDNDGDLDVVTFGLSSTFMEYHRNMSMELYGIPDSLKFQVGNHCWGYASENALSNSYKLFDTCSGNIKNPQLAADTSTKKDTPKRHTGSCELCIDLNNDGTKEFIVGDIQYSNITMLSNGGTPTNGSFIAKDTAFPANNGGTIPINLMLFPCAYSVDVNNDGANDLIASPNSTQGSENCNSVVYYKNIGNNKFPVYKYVQSNFLQDNMIDVGEGAYPTFFDYDNDGLKDLFIGNGGYFSSDITGFKFSIAQFKNIGSATKPAFELITKDYLNLSSLNIQNMVVTFGDLDGDLDADMIIGGHEGKLTYYENIAGPGNPANFVLSATNLKNANNRIIDVGKFATPQIVDVDKDGKNDIIVGSSNGKLSYFHNIGSGITVLPVLDSVTNFWGEVKVSRPGYIDGYSYPFVFDDNGGNTKLLVGSESGYLRLYNQIDGNLNGKFNTIDSTYLNIWQGLRTAPFGADIDNDGYMDLIVGNYQGGVSFYKGVSALSIPTEQLIKFNIDIYPNPANDNINLKITGNDGVNYVLELYNLLGQLVTSKIIIDRQLLLNTQPLKQGMYICKISALDNRTSKKIGMQSKRIVIQH
ncbi:MAG: T9SS type A sorting domain-containing protein [Bacteroidia bacterium]